MESDEQGENQVMISRSYECNFCKRSFSNAQALGGHMNIHRKDKAKIKQTSSNSLEIIHHKLNSSVQDQSKPVHDVYSSKYETHVVSSEMQKPQYCEIPGKITGIESEMALPCSQGSSSELDLELRLGPDPEESSTITRKFLSSVHNKYI